VFADLDSFAVRNTGSDTVTAQGNWWGHPTGPTHSGNPSGEGFGVTDGVDYADFLAEVPVLWPPPPPAEPTLSAGKDSYLPHEPIVVDFSDLAGNATDWITVVLASADTTAYAQWFTTQGETSGSLTFNGLPPGDYEARLLADWPDGGYTVRARHAFTVEDATPPTPEDWTALRVIDPGAEREAAAGWTVSGDLRVGQEAVPPYEGESYFWGGANADTSSGVQDIDVSAYASLIGEERLVARIGAWLRAYEGGNDTAQLRVAYYDPEGELLSAASSDPATTAEWTEHYVERRLPVGTVTIRIGISAYRNIGSDNDGYSLEGDHLRHHRRRGRLRYAVDGCQYRARGPQRHPDRHHR
jgi:hypothetical protein